MKHQTMKATTILSLFALLLMLISRAGMAEVTVPYQNTGHVDGVDWNASTIYIDDSGYKVDGDTLAYSERGKPIVYTSVRQGQAVGFNTTRASTGGYLITEIWMLR